MSRKVVAACNLRIGDVLVDGARRIESKPELASDTPPLVQRVEFKVASGEVVRCNPRERWTIERKP